MEDYRVGVVETRFAELIWSHEPLTNGPVYGTIIRIFKSFDDPGKLPLE